MKKNSSAYIFGHQLSEMQWCTLAQTYVKKSPKLFGCTKGQSGQYKKPVYVFCQFFRGWMFSLKKYIFLKCSDTLCKLAKLVAKYNYHTAHSMPTWRVSEYIRFFYENTHYVVRMYFANTEWNWVVYLCRILTLFINFWILSNVLQSIFSKVIFSALLLSKPIKYWLARLI